VMVIASHVSKEEGGQFYLTVHGHHYLKVGV
jgi:hypothetical protein